MSEERRNTWTDTRAIAAVQGSTRRIGRDDLDVVFQPIYHIESGKIFAAEALTRCKVKGLENPTVLFTRAVEEGATGRLGRKIREVAFDRCDSLPLFVNLHPHELSSRWLVRPDDPLNFHPHSVFLEITESATLEYFDLCMSVVKEVCSRSGAELVIDDLGAGYSNLKRIVDLEPRIVKLDRELVRQLDQSARQRTLVKLVVRLCEELGADVVAEGVETEGELSAVADCGAQFAQGYLLGRPSYPLTERQWPLPLQTSPPSRRSRISAAQLLAGRRPSEQAARTAARPVSHALPPAPVGQPAAAPAPRGAPASDARDDKRDTVPAAPPRGKH